MIRNLQLDAIKTINKKTGHSWYEPMHSVSLVCGNCNKEVDQVHLVQSPGNALKQLDTICPKSKMFQDKQRRILLSRCQSDLLLSSMWQRRA